MLHGFFCLTGRSLFTPMVFFQLSGRDVSLPHSVFRSTMVLPSWLEGVFFYPNGVLFLTVFFNQPQSHPVGWEECLFYSQWCSFVDNRFAQLDGRGVFYSTISSIGRREGLSSPNSVFWSTTVSSKLLERFLQERELVRFRSAPTQCFQVVFFSHHLPYSTGSTRFPFNAHSLRRCWINCIFLVVVGYDITVFFLHNSFSRQGVFCQRQKKFIFGNTSIFKVLTKTIETVFLFPFLLK